MQLWIAHYFGDIPDKRGQQMVFVGAFSDYTHAYAGIRKHAGVDTSSGAVWGRLEAGLSQNVFDHYRDTEHRGTYMIEETTLNEGL